MVFLITVISIISSIMGSILYIINFILESDNGWFNWNTVYKSKWHHHHRYKIEIDSSKPILVVTIWRRYWNKLKRLDVIGVVQKTTMDQLFQDAHRVGQEHVASRTEYVDKLNLIWKFGRKNVKRLGKLVAVSTKLCL